MTLLLMLLFKSLLVFALTGAALLCLRRASASARHLVCLLTLCALLALPVFSLTLPAWHLAVTRAQERKEPTPVRPLPALPAREGAEAGQEALSVSAAPSLSESSPAARTPAKQGGRFSWPPLLLAFYLLGVALAALRPLLGLWGITYLRRVCAPVTDEAARGMLADCAAALKLKRLPRLCRADIPVPMTWGWRRPVVLLPLGSETWPENRLRSVLLHEMAHIKRRDWPGHRLADLACALYWFHPFVWLTARRLRAESEIACDDLVLASGIPAPDYARHLLDIARALPPTSRPPQSAAIAMAQTPHINRRILMVLDATQSRRTVTSRALLAILVPATAALVLLAVLRPDAKAQTASAPVSVASPDAMPTHQALLSVDDLKVDGKSLLAGITDANKPGSPWWSASGALLPTPVYDTDTYHAENHANSNMRNVSFALRLPPNATDMTVRYELPQSIGYSSDGFWPTKIEENAGHTEGHIFLQTHGTRVVTAAFPPTLAKTSLRVGIASGSWTTSVHYLPPSRYDGSITETSGGTMVFRPVATGDFSLTFLPNKTSGYAQKQDLRIVVINALDHKILPVLIGDKSSGVAVQINAQFDVSIGQVKDIRVQTRPFQWIEFRDIALQPSGAAAASAVPLPAETQMDALDAQFDQKKALRLNQAQQIRDHLTSWAQENKATLAQMQQARPDDLASLIRVYTSLIKQPLPLWDGDSRVGKAASIISSYVPGPDFSTLTPALTLTHLERSQEPLEKGIRDDFAKYRDFRIAGSTDPGRNSIVLWASGRITESTVTSKRMGYGKPILSVRSEQIIMPPYFPQPNDKNIGGWVSYALAP